MLHRLKKAIKGSSCEEVARLVYGVLFRVFRMFRKLMGTERRILKRYLSSHQVAKLQIGSGGNHLKGWLNSDFLSPFDKGFSLDATKPFPISNGTFDYVFSEHMIEHIPFEKGQLMLSECFRVLKKGGKIRISTPDLAFLIALYGANKSGIQKDYIEWASKGFIRKAPFDADTFVINNFVRAWGHTFIYDENALRYCLESAGFKEITRRELNQTSDPNLENLENERRIPEGFLQLESLTLEGKKTS